MAELLDRLTAVLAGRYTIERELGRGGMAVVYLARDVRYNRLIALKVMLPEVVGEDGAARFRREIQIAARLNHPHILTVFDSGEDGDLVYYSMPFVEGESLGDAIAVSRQLGIMDAVAIVRQVADALDYAHSQGVVHRDIKPANILLMRTRTGSGRTPLVTDFGIARAMSGDAAQKLTATGLMVGTPTYMSPEQWGGDQQVDGRTDQYALACVLYEMLIGEPPFTGATPMVVLARHTRETVPSLRVVRPTIPEPLEQVIFRALSKVPADRYETMAAFADALTVATEGGINYGTADHPLLGSSASNLPVHSSNMAIVPSTGSRYPAQVAPTGFVDTRGVTASFPVPAKRRLPMVIGASAASVVTAGLIGVGIWYFRPNPPPERTRVVVLPFTNTGTGPIGDSSLADGLTEEVTSRLSGVPGLAVIARTSAMKYKGAPNGLKPIGEELKVTKIVEGRVSWRASATSAPEATVVVTLVDMPEEVQDEVASVDAANLNDLYAIASKVAAKLAPHLGDEEKNRLDARPTENRDAYEAYLRGTRFLNRSWERTDVAAAIAAYDTATTLDSTFAIAFAALGRAHAWFYQLRLDLSPARITAAKKAIDRSFALSPELPEAHLSLGLYYYWTQRDYDRAVAEFKTVQRGLPSSFDAFQQMANVHRRRGSFREAVDNYKLAAELDPRAYQPLFGQAEVLLYIRDYDEAEKVTRQIFELDPEFMDAFLLKASLEVQRGSVATARATLVEMVQRFAPERWRPFHHIWHAGLFRIVDDSLASAERRIIVNKFGLDSTEYYLAKAELYRRHKQASLSSAYFDSAATLIKSVLQRFPDRQPAHGLLGLSHAGLGRGPEAVASAERALELMNDKTDALDGPEWVINLAAVHMLLGDKAKALETLDRALRIPSRLSPKWLELDPQWAPLRNEARFQQLIRNPPPLSLAPINRR